MKITSLLFPLVKSASLKKSSQRFRHINVACRIKLRFRDFIRIVARTILGFRMGPPVSYFVNKRDNCGGESRLLVSRVTSFSLYGYTAEQKRHRLRVRCRMPFHDSTAPQSRCHLTFLRQSGCPESFSRHVHL